MARRMSQILLWIITIAFLVASVFFAISYSIPIANPELVLTSSNAAILGLTFIIRSYKIKPYHFQHNLKKLDNNGNQTNNNCLVFINTTKKSTYPLDIQILEALSDGERVENIPYDTERANSQANPIVKFLYRCWPYSTDTLVTFEHRCNSRGVKWSSSLEKELFFDIEALSKSSWYFSQYKIKEDVTGGTYGNNYQALKKHALKRDEEEKGISERYAQRGMLLRFFHFWCRAIYIMVIYNNKQQLLCIPKKYITGLKNYKNIYFLCRGVSFRERQMLVPFSLCTIIKLRKFLKRNIHNLTFSILLCTNTAYPDDTNPWEDDGLWYTDDENKKKIQKPIIWYEGFWDDSLINNLEKSLKVTAGKVHKNKNITCGPSAKDFYYFENSSIFNKIFNAGDHKFILSIKKCNSNVHIFISPDQAFIP